jgi:hypothetical protein
MPAPLARPGRIHGEHSFFGEPREQHSDGGHVLFDRGRRGLALEAFDICGNCDRLNVFEVLISGALSPGQELLDCPVISGSCVRVADRDREKFEELLAGLWAGACDDGWSCERVY